MKTVLRIAFAVLLIAMTAAISWLWTPAPAGFDREKARTAAEQYDVRIIRDAFGVPHIYAERDADAAFGLAYAHAEDDWKTIEDVIFFTRGQLAQYQGRDAAIPDFLVRALRIHEDIDAKYEQDLSLETRRLAEAYAAGLNLWCAEEKGRCAFGAAPVTGKDIVAGFVSRTPFFYGLDEELRKIFDGDLATQAQIDASRTAYFRNPPGMEFGSNAMAISPRRSADGHTRLMVNSHQPYEGPVAWYEARVKTNEGWDMIGGLFPGAPMILHGAGPNLGWAFTVNRPDLVDVYALQVDDTDDPTRYFFSGSWRSFETRWTAFRVKLWGRFSLPVRRKIYNTVHGPAFVSENGVYAVSYAGAGDIQAIEQWRRMNKATTYDDWRAAMEMTAIPSFHVVYADRTGDIAYHYNAAAPVRSEDQNWSKIAEGASPDLLWAGRVPFDALPAVVRPASGFVVNANNGPYEASLSQDAPQPEDFAQTLGIDQRTTNRGARLLQLFGEDASITEEEFLTYKFDHHYAEDSRVMRFLRDLITRDELSSDPAMAPVIDLLSGWHGQVTAESREAPLALYTAAKELGGLMDKEGSTNGVRALKETVAELQTGFGRIDPMWGEVVRLRRGSVDLPLNGGPDTLRAVYPESDPANGAVKAAGGDTYILYADWDRDGALSVRTIHQYGAATLDENSPHYNDQAPIFANEGWKIPPMTLDDLMKEATADYSPGKRYQ